MIGAAVLAAGPAEAGAEALCAETLQDVLGVDGIDRVLVMLGANADRVREALDLGDAEPVVCREWSEGRAALLRTAAAELSDAEAIVVVDGGSPPVPGAVAAVLAHPAGDHAAVCATCDGRRELPAVLERRLFPTLATFRGDTVLRDLLANVAVADVEVGS